MPEGPTQLRRSLGFWALLAYGVGDMLGAGIYALVGKVAGVSGTWAWASFGIAMAAATLTALVYADLATRYPRSGGAAYYCERAFGRPAISLFIGWLVLCSGLVSMGASSLAFAGYLHELFPGIPNKPAAFGFLTAVGIITIRGIRESSAANIVCTMIELSGLLLVIVTGLALIFGAGANEAHANASAAAAAPVTALMVLQAAGIAFYACIGFEDIANVAEEVKSPEKTIPAALVSAMVVVSAAYMTVAYIATSAIPVDMLTSSEAPLATVVKTTAPWAPLTLFSGIAMFAVANSCLLNSVMASRLLYGLSREGLLPEWLGALLPGRQTPYRASLLVIGVAAALALTGTVSRLAATTSLLLLAVFVVVSLALLVVRRRREDRGGGFRAPVVVPILSIAICLSLIAASDRSALYLAAGVAGVGAGAVALHRSWRGRRATQ